MCSYLDDPADDDHVLLVSDVLNAAKSAADDAHQRNNRVPELWALIIEQVQQEIKLLSFLDLEQVVANQLIY